MIETAIIFTGLMIGLTAMDICNVLREIVRELKSLHDMLDMK